jgi:large subunit ribosomal protein L44e
VQTWSTEFRSKLAGLNRLFEGMVKRYKSMCDFLYAKSVVVEVNVPKEIRTYCPKCKQHQAHSVTLYKAGKRRPLAKGERHHELREKRGYGGQKYPLQREFAKTTKKQTLKLKCKVCGYMRHKDGIRLRKLAIV